MKYACIEEHRAEFRVSAMCRVLDVCRDGFYVFLKRSLSRRSREDLVLRQEIVKASQAQRWAPGALKLWHILNTNGIRCGKHRLARLRKLEGIESSRKKRFRVLLSKESVQPPVPDLVKRRFTAAAPNQVWVGDITTLKTREGWLHLAIVLDLFSRRIVGWRLDTKQDASLPMGALAAAMAERQPATGLIFHSDQGSVYASDRYRKMLREHGALPSMSRKGNCHDNAVAESFFSSLKNETQHDRICETRDEARAVVNDYIGAYYNKRRLHQTLAYQTPASVEMQFRVLN